MSIAEEQQITENQRQKLKRLLTNDPLKFVVLYSTAKQKLHLSSDQPKQSKLQQDLQVDDFHKIMKEMIRLSPNESYRRKLWRGLGWFAEDENKHPWIQTILKKRGIQDQERKQKIKEQTTTLLNKQHPQRLDNIKRMLLSRKAELRLVEERGGDEEILFQRGRRKVPEEKKRFYREWYEKVCSFLESVLQYPPIHLFRSSKIRYVCEYIKKNFLADDTIGENYSVHFRLIFSKEKEKFICDTDPFTLYEDYVEHQKYIKYLTQIILELCSTFISKHPEMVELLEPENNPFLDDLRQNQKIPDGFEIKGVVGIKKSRGTGWHRDGDSYVAAVIPLGDGPVTSTKFCSMDTTNIAVDENYCPVGKKLQKRQDGRYLQYLLEPHKHKKKRFFTIDNLQGCGDMYAFTSINLWHRSPFLQQLQPSQRKEKSQMTPIVYILLQPTTMARRDLGSS